MKTLRLAGSVACAAVVACTAITWLLPLLPITKGNLWLMGPIADAEGELALYLAAHPGAGMAFAAAANPIALALAIAAAFMLLRARSA